MWHPTGLGSEGDYEDQSLLKWDKQAARGFPPAPLLAKLKVQHHKNPTRGAPQTHEKESTQSWGYCSSQLLHCITKHPETAEEKQESHLQRCAHSQRWTLGDTKHWCASFRNHTLLFWNLECIMSLWGTNPAGGVCVCVCVCMCVCV